MIKAIECPTVPGTPCGGGFYAGRININNQVYALIVAPKQAGEKESAWNKSSKNVPDAVNYCDGHANTAAMAAAGSTLAKWVQKLRIGDLDGWYLPSRDELEILYRHLKPTTRENYQYRSGDNPSSVPAGYPYTASAPAQVTDTAFQAGGAEAFEAAWYWSSTQLAAVSAYAWMQYFDDGNQNYYHKSGEYRARAVRRLLIIE